MDNSVAETDTVLEPWPNESGAPDLEDGAGKGPENIEQRQACNEVSGPTTRFQRILRDLEAEHLREVSELQSKIARLCEGDPQCACAPSEMLPSKVPPPLLLPCELMRLDVPDGIREAGKVDAESSAPSAPTMVPNMIMSPPMSNGERSTDIGSPVRGHTLMSHTTSSDSQIELERMLQVTIVSASGLRSADWGIGASSDPYVLCEIPEKAWARFQTPVLERTLDPRWECTGVLVDYAEGEDISFVVRDRDWGRQDDDILGRLTLPAHKFWPQGFEGQLELEDAGKGHHSTLTVKVSEFLPKDGAKGLQKPWLHCPHLWMQTQQTAMGPALPKRRARMSMQTMEDFQAKLPSKCMLQPDSPSRSGWDIAGIFVLLLDLVWIPMQVFEIPYSEPLEVLYWTRLLYWSTDIVFTCNTGYYTHDAKLVLRRRLVLLNYLRGWLIFDFFIVGVDWLSIIQRWASGTANGVGENAGAARAGKLARVFRIARFLRLLRLGKLRHMLPSLQGLINSEWLMIVFVVSKNLITILVLSHYIACAWFAVGSINSNANGWVEKHSHDREPYGTQYVVSWHWSLANLTPGKSPIDPGTPGEHAFASIVLILAMVVATCFVSSITSSLGQVWSMNRYTATQLFLLKKFLKQSGISRSLSLRVTRYIDGVLELRHNQVHPSKVDFLGLLSGPLNVELHQEMRLPVLKMFPPLHQYSLVNLGMTGQVCTTCVSSSYFSKNDVIFRDGFAAEYMFFVQVGALAYRYDRERRITTKLEPDQWCSEAVLWVPWMHCGQLKAIAHCDLTMLCAVKFIDLTCTSQDVYKFCRGCACLFWETLQEEVVTDLPWKLWTEDGDSEAVPRISGNSESGSGAAMRIKEAEDAEVHLTRFD